MDKNQLELKLKEGEGLYVEFKERYSSKIDRDIVAFANSRGGYLLLGVNDNGGTVGANLTNKLKAEIVDLARNCEPEISIKNITEIHNVIVIEIEESQCKPHSCSQGFYRRLNAITQKMTQKEIKLLFKENENKTPFEELIHSNGSFNDIDIEKIDSFLKAAHISISEYKPKNILQSLKLSNNNDIKNAGILFFDKNPQSKILQCQTFMVAFKGTKRVHIYDRIDVQDDLLTQFNQAQLFLKKHLNVRTEIKDFDREDIYEIPLDALREAVANAIIHRDYSMRGTNITIEVHEDRVVICNPGGIPEGVDIKSLLSGVSMRRNELIADMFSRIDKAERMGSGLKRIADIMEKADQPFPEIESNLFFRITFKRPYYPEPMLKSSDKSSDKSSEINANMVLNQIRKNPKITAKQMAAIFNITSRAIEKHISKLKAAGILRRAGSKKHGHWEIKTES